MSDLRWSVPLSNWSFRDLSAAATVARLDFIEPMTWRRLSALSKTALQVAHDCCAGLQSPVRMVFASRHGELERTTAILRAICAGEPVSPNAFSLSVLNAVTGIFGIARRDQSPATAISASVETLGYALLDAGMQHRQQPDWPVLLVYAHERVDPLYGAVTDDALPSALALLIDAQRARGYLECALRYEPQREPRHESGADTASANPANANLANANPAPLFTQSDALHHCLAMRASSAWQGPRHMWRWRWQESARPASAQPESTPEPAA